MARGRHGIAATRAEKEPMLLDIFEIAKTRSVIDLISRSLGIGLEVVRVALHPHRTGKRPSNQIDERRRALHTMTMDGFLGGMRHDQKSESLGERFGARISTCSTMCGLHDLSSPANSQSNGCRVAIDRPHFHSRGQDSKKESGSGPFL